MSRSPSPPPPSLDTLPVDVVCLIASHLRTSEIWRLMATCRSLREGGELALIPTLAAAEVVSYVPSQQFYGFPNEAYDSIREDFALRSKARGEAVRVVNKIYERHLIAYPPAEKALRKLTVELRDDDDESGWKLLKRFQHQLEELEIDMYDHLWVLAMLSGPLRGHTSDPYDLNNSSLSVHDIFDLSADGLDVWIRSLSGFKLEFPKLHTLTIAATARVTDHLCMLAPSVPNLRSLTLICHFDSEDYGCTALAWDEPGICLFNKLSRLMIHGSAATVHAALSEVLPEAPNLEDLFIQLSDYADDEYLELHLDHIMDLHRLRGLAIFGQSAFDYMRVMRLMQDKGRKPLSNLDTLILEKKKFTEYDECSYALLSQPEIHRPALPSLRFISWVDESDYDDSKYGFNRAFRDGDGLPSSFDIYEPDDLRELAKQYDRLEVAQWVLGYPEDPFDLNSTAKYGGHLLIRDVWPAGELPAPSTYWYICSKTGEELFSGDHPDVEGTGRRLGREGLGM